MQKKPLLLKKSMKSKHSVLSIILFAILLVGFFTNCKKENTGPRFDVPGFRYTGSGNDANCDSDPCSLDRERVGTATNVLARVNSRGGLSANFESDLAVLFIPCEPIDSSFRPAQSVRFSGTAINACGFVSANEPFFRASFFIQLTQIDSIP